MRVLLVFGGVLVVIVIAFVVFLNVIPTGTDTDCSKVSLPDAAEFQALDDEQRQSRVTDLNACKKLVGLTRDELQAALGPPAKTFDNALVYEFATNGNYAGGQPYPPDTTAFLLGGDGRVTDFEDKENGAPTN